MTARRIGMARPVSIALPTPFELRPSARATRLSMRIDPSSGRVAVTVPFGVPPAEVERFVLRNAGWAEQRLARLPPARPLVTGAHVPILGRDRLIRHDPAHRGLPMLEDDSITVGGSAEFVARRLIAFLRAEARRHLADASRAKAAQVGKPVAAVSVRDTTSRWGSCAANGRLSYSWRLILAPDFVIDYVVAHEVAHLVELNHSRRFWRVVERLTPHLDAGRDWLKRNGAGLLRIGTLA